MLAWLLELWFVDCCPHPLCHYKWEQYIGVLRIFNTIFATVGRWLRISHMLVLQVLLSLSLRVDNDLVRVSFFVKVIISLLLIRIWHLDWLCAAEEVMIVSHYVCNTRNDHYHYKQSSHARNDAFPYWNSISLSTHSKHALARNCITIYDALGMIVCHYVFFFLAKMN